MSTSTQPITPEFFLQAIRDLQLEQLHVESARLQNSIYHLQRSNIALEEEGAEEAACKDAIKENEEVIRRQTERIGMIKDEVERRGFKMGHGEVNGKGSGENGEEEGVKDEEEQGGVHL